MVSVTHLLLPVRVSDTTLAALAVVLCVELPLKASFACSQ